MQRNHNNFCGTCQKVDTKVCTQREKLLQLYQNGEWTENSQMLGPRGWTKWAWDHPEQSNGNSSIIRQSQSNNPGLINYGNMLYPACTGQGLIRELYQQPTNTVSGDAISQYCGPTWPHGPGALPCQTHNSMCNNPLCHKHALNCQRPQGLSKADECPGEGYRS
jgi:hypothetical protein